MVVMIIKPICDNCHKEKRERPFSIDWEYEKKTCSECHHDEIQTRRFRFCSSKCMKEWANKFHGHRHKWEVHMTRSGATTDNGDIKEVLAFCSICKAQDWRTEKRLKKQYHDFHKDYLKLSKGIYQGKSKKRKL